MKVTLEKHIEYSKSPELFMKEKWLTFDVLKTLTVKEITPFSYQTGFIKSIHESKHSLVIKSRQMHVSSMMALYIAWYVLFNANKNVLIVSHNYDGATRILETIKMILQNYSIEGDVNQSEPFTINNKTRLELKNKSRIEAIGPRCDAGKGEVIDLFYCDEAAYIKDFESIWASILMCVVIKGKIILASSPNDNSYFNHLYNAALKEDTINKIKLHWSIHPSYSKDIIYNPFELYPHTSPWFNDMCTRLRDDPSIIAQELECVVNYKEKIVKQKTISLRIEYEMYKKIKNRLTKGETASDYIRKLIEKDLS